ncbi:Fibroblast growth factor receptor substrate 2 [Halotydeus destructor]|nr:Fibroblast growth factor receptor substrate 2 [Halotydeus destructor]
MGCVYSGPGRPWRKKSITGTRISLQAAENQVNAEDNSQRIFKVINVDDHGTEINCGNIEITSNDLILHQRGKSSILWPLRSLRRYGFDSELFSFECGRRCQTGPGIYAFRCSQAEQLFNALQEAIQSCSSTNFPTATGTGFMSTNSLIESRPSGVNSLPGSPATSPVTGTAAPEVPTGPRRNSRLLLGSCSSAAHTNETNHDEARHNAYTNSPFYVNTSATSNLPSATAVPSHSLHTGVTDINTNYAKLDDLVRYYVNIKTPTLPTGSANGSISGPSDKGDPIATGLPVVKTTKLSQGSSVPTSPVAVSTRKDSSVIIQKFVKPTSLIVPKSLPTEQTNYIQLDLDSSSNSFSAHFVTTAPATPVTKTPKNGPHSWTPPGTPTSLTSPVAIGPSTSQLSYAKIDFDKTMALNSVVSKRKCN